MKQAWIRQGLASAKKKDPKSAQCCFEREQQNPTMLQKRPRAPKSVNERPKTQENEPRFGKHAQRALKQAQEPHSFLQQFLDG